jgi:hypothetical protein
MCEQRFLLFTGEPSSEEDVVPEPDEKKCKKKSKPVRR